MHGPGLLKGPCLESLPHLDVVKAPLIKQAELLHAPPHQLHGEGAPIDWGAWIQCRNNLQQG